MNNIKDNLKNLYVKGYHICQLKYGLNRKNECNKCLNLLNEVAYTKNKN